MQVDVSGPIYAVYHSAGRTVRERLFAEYADRDAAFADAEALQDVPTVIYLRVTYQPDRVTAPEQLVRWVKP